MIKICNRYGCDVKVRDDSESYCKMHKAKAIIKKSPVKPKDPNEIRKYTCRICKEKYSKQVRQHWIYWCSDDCQSTFIKQLIEKQRIAKEKADKRAWAVEKKKRKEELGIKDPDPLVTACQKIARLIDKDESCLARPTEAHSKFDGGHIFGKGAWPSIKYNLWNIHKQGKYSNRSQKDDALIMDGFEIRYGKEKLEWLKSLKIKYSVLKLTKPEQREKLRTANQIIRDLQNGEEYTRDDVNKMLDIYK